MSTVRRKKRPGVAGSSSSTQFDDVAWPRLGFVGVGLVIAAVGLHCDSEAL